MMSRTAPGFWMTVPGGHNEQEMVAPAALVVAAVTEYVPVADVVCLVAECVGLVVLVLGLLDQYWLAVDVVAVVVVVELLVRIVPPTHPYAKSLQPPPIMRDE